MSPNTTTTTCRASFPRRERFQATSSSSSSSGGRKRIMMAGTATLEAAILQKAEGGHVIRSARSAQPQKESPGGRSQERGVGGVASRAGACRIKAMKVKLLPAGSI